MSRDIRRLLAKAEERKMLAIDSEAARGVHYVLDPGDESAMILHNRNGRMERVVVPYTVLRELKKIAEVYCG